MSVIVNDSIQANAPKSLDNKYLNLGVVPYSTASEANAAILSAYRSRGLTVLVGSAEYWYRDAIGDVNLVPKGIPSVVSPLSIDLTTQIMSIAKATNSTDGYLALGDWTTFNNKLSTVATAFSVTNTGVSGNPITLVNDQSTPGFSKMYGTNSSGVKGWYSIPIASGGGSSVWGGITGTLSDQTDAYNAIQSKEPSIAVGTTSQYWRGDKSWQLLNTSVVPEGSNPYFTTARARSSLSAGAGIAYNTSTGVITSTITQADGTETKINAGTNITVTGLGSTASPYIINTSGGGTVTSVGLSSTDLTVSGSPIVASGIITANLTNTGVTAGSYTLAALTIDAKGRITAATNGAIPIASPSVLGAVKIGTNITVDGTGLISVAFPSPVATTGTLGYIKVGTGLSIAIDGTLSTTIYSLPIATSSALGGIKVGSGLAIDGTGVLSSTSGGGSVTSVALTSTDLSVSGSPITGAGTFVANLTATGVGAGTYNNVTVDTKGRVTSASNASYITGNQTITLAGDTTGSGTTAITTTLSTTGVSAGTYTRATITVDAKGRISAASSNGAVTSVGLTSSDLTITGSPITTSGTFTATLNTVNTNVGTFNNVTVNAKGLVTAASNASYITANQTITLSGDVAGSGTTAITATIQPASVTYSKIQSVGSQRLLGRYAGTSGATQEISLGNGLALDSSTGILSVSGGGVVLLYSSMGVAQAANTTSVTSMMGAGYGTTVLPAGFFTSGRTLRIKAAGTFSTQSGFSGTMLVTIKAGTTTLANESITNLNGSSLDQPWSIDITVTCPSPGTSGTMFTGGGLNYTLGTTGQGVAQYVTQFSNSANSVTLNTTLSQTIDLNVQWSVANTSNVWRSTVATIEALN